jgi:hypothetical protein
MSRGEQPAADDQSGSVVGIARGRPLRRGPDRVQVLDRAVDEAAGQVAAGDGRDEGIRAGRENQRVVADGATATRHHRLANSVYGLDRVIEMQGALAGRVARLGDEIQSGRVHSVEVGRERYPVVGRPRLRAQDGDLPTSVAVTLPDGFDESLPDHAVAHHNQLSACNGNHRYTLFSTRSARMQEQVRTR